MTFKAALLYACLLACIVGAAQPSSAPVLGSKEQSTRLSQLRGKKVEDLDGQKLGVIRDLIIDLKSGQVNYVIVGTGGVVGVGSKAKIVPSQDLSAATAKKRTVALNVPKSRWKYAPAFKKRDLATLADPANALQIRRFYARSADDFRAAERAPTGSKPAGPAPTNPDGAPVGKTRAPVLHLASILLGKPVLNRQQESLGEITDLVVDLSGHKPALAEVTKRKLLKGEQSTIVRLQGAKTNSNGELFVSQ